MYTTIANELVARPAQVQAAVTMLDEGATVPFISRYRKEATGGLSDSQLRLLQERLGYLRDLDTRRDAIIKAIDEQGKLDDVLRKQILSADTKSALEDIYLPFKKKRKTKGQAAIAAGLEPLADSLWSDASQDPEKLAATFINTDAGFDDTKSVLEGARYILMERFAIDTTLLSQCRDKLADSGYLCAAVFAGKESEGEKFRDYFDHQERLSKVPSHRALAMFRGRSEGVLALSLKLPESTEESGYGISECIALVSRATGFNHTSQAADDWRAQVVNWTWKVKLGPHLEAELLSDLRERADTEAIRVFASNLHDLLLAAPAGQRCTMGLDPGYRSGVKVAVVSATGKLLDHMAIYPHAPQKQWDKAKHDLCELCKKHQVELIAIGNGTASRETEQLAVDVLKQMQNPGLEKIVVSEAGASVYSASETAEKEFPDLDVTIRGAISIARRLQDPLAELVKIDPKAIGVGQYQHDVSQFALARSLDATVEDCVNSVGVDLNTASSALLSRVSGLGETLAGNIVEFRDEHGSFADRSTLKKVPRLGPKAFEQCAGFLRINAGKNPLDASGVHPEAYPVIKDIEKQTGKPVGDIIGRKDVITALDASEFTTDSFGLPTIQDILAELLKPGRDPRPDFRTVKFDDAVSKISQLTVNAIMEGQVTNVTNFGAFVDVGVHQDGLVHISALSDTFVKDPHQVVKAGDIVKVKVMSVDEQRNRIALSMRLSDDGRDDAGSGSGSGSTGSAAVKSGKPGSSSGVANGMRGGGGGAAGNSRHQAGRKHKHQNAQQKEQQKGRAVSSRQSPPSALALQLEAAINNRNSNKKS